MLYSSGSPLVPRRRLRMLVVLRFATHITPDMNLPGVIAGAPGLVLA
jgi:hypothetical protein